MEQGPVITNSRGSFRPGCLAIARRPSTTVRWMLRLMEVGLSIGGRNQWIEFFHANVISLFHADIPFM
jgi:hypothetical protein